MQSKHFNNYTEIKIKIKINNNLNYRPLLKPTTPNFKKNTHPPLTFDPIIGQYWLMVHFVDLLVTFQNHFRYLGLSLAFTHLHEKSY